MKGIDVSRSGKQVVKISAPPSVTIVSIIKLYLTVRIVPTASV